MLPSLALLLCCGFAWWLFKIDRPPATVGRAWWIPLLWLLILGSRPISSWFGFQAYGDNDAALLEGSPFDRAFFLALIAAGAGILIRRNIDWRFVRSQNRWLWIFFGYLALSTLWSPFPFVSLKRWVKDFGNVIMVLVIVTDRYPVHVTKLVLARVSYVLIPFSVLVVKYFPESGRYYDQWNGTQSISGLSADKNMLGMTLVACGLSLIWLIIDRGGPQKTARMRRMMLALLLVMDLWLLWKSNSSTAMACFALGLMAFAAIRFSGLRRWLKWAGAAAAVGLVLFIVGATSTGKGESLFRFLGRDATLTGRTEIWSSVLKEDINPLLGEGFYSFWMAGRATKLSEEYHYELNEAHNGFLETYLNSGLVGLTLLCVVLLAASKHLKNQAFAGEPIAAMRFVAFIIIIPYAVTEAVFNRLNLLWFLCLLAVVRYPGNFTRVSAPRGRQKLAEPLGREQAMLHAPPAAAAATSGRSLQ